MRLFIYSCLILFVIMSGSCNTTKNPQSPNYEPLIEISTDLGTIQVKLYSNTPKHRDNFLKLVKMGFYDDLMFHRVIDQFMIQGGDPDSKDAAPGAPLGNGGPGYRIPAEFSTENIHIKGALAAARQGDFVNPEKESSGSQFYIVQGRILPEEMLDQQEERKGFTYTKKQRKCYMKEGGTPHLDQDYTVFGEVTKGMDVIDKIAKVATDRANRPNEDIRMTMRIIR